MSSALAAQQARTAELEAARAADQALIAHQKLMIEKLRREKFGPRAERLSRLIEQMEFELEELEAKATEDELAAEMVQRPTGTVTRIARRHPARMPFPAHLPRERVVVPARSPVLAAAARDCRRWARRSPRPLR